MNNLRISKYGVVLSRLTEDKIELVRNWRNDPKISQYMQFKEHISSDMQIEWFHKINNNNNYYFIIEVQGKEIGLINIRDIDYDQKVGEAGIFIYDDDYLNGTVSFQSHLCILDFAFETLGLEFIIAHIMKNNKRAIQYNMLFGYKKQSGQEDIDNQLYVLCDSDYKKNREKILTILNI